MSLRTADEGLHRAIRGRKIQSLLDHWEILPIAYWRRASFNKRRWLRG
jgi:hypothetical protein